MNGDPVFVRFSGIDVTTESYTGKPFTIERGPLDYYLLDSGNNSDLTLMDEDVVEKTFFVPDSTKTSRRDMNCASSSAATITTTKRSAEIRSLCSLAATCGRL